MKQSLAEITAQWRVAFFEVFVQLGATAAKGATDYELSQHFSLPLRPTHARRFEMLRMGIIQPSGLVRDCPWNEGATVWELVDAIHIPESEPPEDRTHCDIDFQTEHQTPRNRAGIFCPNSHTHFHPDQATIARGTIRCWGCCPGDKIGFYCYPHPMYGLSWALNEHPR